MALSGRRESLNATTASTYDGPWALSTNSDAPGSFPLPNLATSVWRDHTLRNPPPAGSGRSLGEGQRGEPLGLGDPFDLDRNRVDGLDEARDVLTQRVRASLSHLGAQRAFARADPEDGEQHRRGEQAWRYDEEEIEEIFVREHGTVRVWSRVERCAFKHTTERARRELGETFRVSRS